MKDVSSPATAWRSLPRSKALALLAASGAMVAAVAFTGCSGQPAKGPTATQPVETASGSAGVDLQNAFVTVVEHVRLSIVQIQTNVGLGSGVVYDANGDIVTNNHVVSGASTIEVTTADGKTQAASLRGTFAAGDLAVIQVTGHLNPAVFADSTTLKVGMIVLAIGNPLGLQSSVTEGIVSAVDRTVSEPGGITLPDTIQTSAAINPGNSGGALVDLAGHVVGIPTLTAADPTLGAAANGIGFAIPANTVKDIAGQIIATGHVTNSHRANIGIRAGTVVDSSENPVGVLIAAVAAGGSAAKAGLATGDIIVQFGDMVIRTTTDLSVALADSRPGQVVSLTVITAGGARRVVSVTVGELPAG
ncbi:MAG TPA: trypsin-like peptidase domain-containing protein [Candidatus Acidoferrales bacterium]|nr:trypsin-like peptidase domain-containing protein [Candidatus Acidoferrales bacterium]